jgi:tRNA(His) guanylyltransferase
VTHDSLGDRIKRYESVSSPLLLRRTPVLLRVDGKAFHTYTRDMKRPFDADFMDAMVYATDRTSKEMMGFRLAYTQSDEATFALSDYATEQTEPWLGYEVNKLVSITASMFTAYFNAYMRNCLYETKARNLAFFDCRAFNVPLDDAANVFVWRQKDWHRNSLQMFARSHFTHEELDGKNTEDIHEMLHEVGANWVTDLDAREKNGTFVAWAGTFCRELDYFKVRGYLELCVTPKT